ncbi:8879_t:CDS:2 [Paraglomus brasilianum]|uniref:Ataxin-3 homolog n=1 Tax=Paraglomus brasilianum TaxID=144538 RepID=A0A9N8W6Q7_9GLOM|nr:8879_t:CDS:2 [Paraglomus brasilianum]
MSDLLPYLVWEKQEGYLCAQHCLNALLQGEYFTAVDLSDIARELDEAESAALDNTDEDNEGSEAKKSQNMDDTGFFSVQVLVNALKLWNVDIIPYGSEDCVDARIHPENEMAYICNLHEHWFTLRKFGNSPLRWYNLDSVLKGPEWISQTYLGMLLTQLKNDGYSIFVVKGIFPSCQADDYAISHPEANEHKENKKSADTDEEMLQAAIAASLLSLSETNDGQQESSSSSSSRVDSNSQPTATTPPSTLEELRKKRLARFDSNDVNIE